MTRLMHFVEDVRLSARALGQRPVLLTVAVASIAIGAGLNMSVYSVSRRVLFQSIVTAAAPERLTRIAPGISFPNYQDLRRDDLPIDLVAMQMSELTCRFGTGTTMVSAHVVSDNFFDVVGVRPILGRTFTPRDRDREVAVVAFGFWQRLGGDSALLGESIQLNGWPYEVVGVLPRGFGATAVVSGAVYVPVSPHVAVALDNRRVAQFDMFGRLHDDVTVDRATAALRLAGGRLEARFPDANRGLARELVAGPMTAFGFLRQLPAGPIVLAAAATLYGLVGLVLIAACANVAGLLTSRLDERRHELAVRIALGATRADLTRQLLAESFVIGSLGCATALLLWMLSAAWLATKLTMPSAAELMVLPASLPFGYCLVLVVTVTVLCGLAPVLSIEDVSVASRLQMRRLGRFRRMSLQRAMVAVQIAICCVLLTAGALLLHNLWQLRRMDVGFDASHTAEIEWRLPTSAKPPDIHILRDALAAMAGVRAVSWGSPLGPPFTERLQPVDPDGSGNIPVDVRPVGPHFFETIGVAMTLGRDVIEQDVDARDRRPIVVNETFVRKYMSSAGTDPIGREFRRAANPEIGRGEQILRIVGVARDSMARTIGESRVPVAYIPQRLPSLIVRTAGPSASALRSLQRTIEGLEPAGTVVTASSLQDGLGAALMPLEVATLGLGVLGIIGCLLGMTGLFAVVSRAAARRTFEIAVRVAIGASRASIIWLIVRDALRTIALGCAAGSMLTLVSVRLVQAAMTTQSLIDPVALGVTIVLLFAIGIAASLHPALRAGRTDPILALRGE